MKHCPICNPCDRSIVEDNLRKIQWESSFNVSQYAVGADELRQSHCRGTLAHFNFMLTRTAYTDGRVGYDLYENGQYVSNMQLNHQDSQNETTVEWAINYLKARGQTHVMAHIKTFFNFGAH